MHVCFVSPTPVADEDSWGGVHTHTEMVTNLLRKMDTEVTLVTPSSAAAPKHMQGVNVICCSPVVQGVMNPTWMQEVRDAFHEIHASHPVDCLFSQDYWAFGLHEELKILNIPIVTFIHNFSLVHFYNNLTDVKGIRSFAYYLLRTIPDLVGRIFKYELPFYKSSKYIVPVSQRNAQHLRNVYRLPRDQVRAIHNWVDTNVFAPRDSNGNEVRAQHAIPDNALVFLLVGSLWHPKGFHVAARCFNRLAKAYAHIWLFIAGGEEDKRFLERAGVDSDAVEGRIVFSGRLAHEQIPAVHDAADVFVSPSLLAEGCPYALLEAMASGLPTIASNIGGHPELLDDAGILVRPGSTTALTKAMASLIEDGEKRESMSRAVRQRALDLFSEDTATKRFASILEDLTIENRVS